MTGVQTCALPILLTAKTRLRLLPPLILTADDVDDALAILRSVLEKCV